MWKTSKKACAEGRKRNKSVAVWVDGDYEAVIPRIRRERRSGCTDANFAVGLCSLTVSFVDSRTVGCV